MWAIDRRIYLGDYESGCAALRGVKLATDPDGELAPFAGVVSLCPMPLLPDHDISGPVLDETEWLHIPIFDGGAGETEFEQALGVALPFIKRRRARGNVLIHCAAGMSRSVSMIAAVLCDEDGLTPDDAFDRIALAKSKSFEHLGYPPDLLIAPAWEFQSCLRRLYRP